MEPDEEAPPDGGTILELLDTRALGMPLTHEETERLLKHYETVLDKVEALLQECF